MSTKFFAYKSSILLIFAFYLWAGFCCAEKTSHILIVANSNDLPYQEAIKGFSDKMSVGNSVKFTEIIMTQFQVSPVKQISTLKPDLIFALGIEAIRWASQQTSSIPIVATMVLKDDVFRRSSNISGVSLGYSIKTQIQWAKKFFPQQDTLAVLYNPNENGSVVQEISKICLQNGLKLVLIPVETPKELPVALEQLAKNVQILLAIPDETAMSVTTAKEVLLASFRNKVPMIGLSENWVKSGAFYSLSWDYVDLGEQSADLAQKLLNSNSGRSIPPEQPRKVTYTINAKIAEHMSMDIPEDLLSQAKQIFN